MKIIKPVAILFFLIMATSSLFACDKTSQCVSDFSILDSTEVSYETDFVNSAFEDESNKAIESSFETESSQHIESVYIESEFDESSVTDSVYLESENIESSIAESIEIESSVIVSSEIIANESSEDVSEETSSEIIESSEAESVPDESSEVDSTPSESVPAESEAESSKEESSEPIESSEEESSEPIEESSEAEPVISTIPSVPSEDDPIENDPVEESSEAESSAPTEESKPTEEDPFAKYHVQINTMSQEEAEALIEECILMYINKYRVEEGKCEMTMLTGKSRAFARGRSEQLTTNFAHDYDDRISLANELEYGIYEPEREEFYYDREKGEIVYTGNMTPAYYKPYGGEAISEVIAEDITYIDIVAESSAAGIFLSKAHWEYIGGANSDCIAIGVTLNGRGGAYICYLNMDSESAELYD